MFKHISTVLLLALGAASASYAQNAGTVHFSAHTRQFISDSKLNHGKLLNGYVYKEIGGRQYISSFIRVTPDIDRNALEAMGCYIGTEAGAIWTVQIPVEKVALLSTVRGLDYVDVDMPVMPHLDYARKATKADSAQGGYHLPVPFTGNGVVVGIIDAGFDFTHPTFYDTTYTNYRVRRVWTQKRSGTPPTGFSYGTELSDPFIIRATGFDTLVTTHGTHVAGIAAGSGYGSPSNSKFRGMAYQSDLAFVGIMPAPGQWAVAGATDIIDGMNYLFSYAASVYKPCVVNLSWGSSIGPHDGLSLFGQACNTLTGPGKIFVCSAGNNGEDTIHLGKTFTATDNKVSTFVNFSPYLPADDQKTWVDVWGDSSHSFCLNFKLYDGTTISDSTAWMCMADTTIYDTVMGSDGQPLYVTVALAANEYNGKPHALVTLFNTSVDKVCLSASGTSGSIHMWEGYVEPPSGYYGSLKAMGYSWATDGDNQMTVSDISCSKAAICVGAYTSKSGFTNVSGVGLSYPGATIGKIAPFSSLGPVPDGRILPHIAGPGFALASSVSSYDTSYMTGGTNYNVVITKTPIGGRTYPYAMAAGTSMSSPAVAGIVALLLEMHSTMTPDSVRNLLAVTAITDSYTGILPAAGNNTWGHGKVNAYKALRQMATGVQDLNTLTADALDCMLFPNPNNGNYTISFNSAVSQDLFVTVTDITGRVVLSESWNVSKGLNAKHIALSYMPSGLYLTNISTGIRSVVLKTMVH